MNSRESYAFTIHDGSPVGVRPCKGDSMASINPKQLGTMTKDSRYSRGTRPKNCPFTILEATHTVATTPGDITHSPAVALLYVTQGEIAGEILGATISRICRRCAAITGIKEPDQQAKEQWE